MCEKVGASSDGTVRYCDFLDKFCSATGRPPSGDRWRCATIRLDVALVDDYYSKCNMFFAHLLLATDDCSETMPEIFS
jgi:hypothetical protein